MATKKPVKNTAPERAIINIREIPGQNTQDDVIISINGETWQIQRGVDVSVPIRVARAFELWMRECKDAQKTEYSLIFEG